MLKGLVNFGNGNNYRIVRMLIMDFVFKLCIIYASIRIMYICMFICIWIYYIILYNVLFDICIMYI